ncbi:MAG: AraC family transcriptional regulator [Marinoscillum sp.]
MAETIYVKNMVCPRCISVVTEIFESFNSKPEEVKLGEVRLPSKPTKQNLHLIAEKLKSHGFEILAPGKSAIIAKVKSTIIDQIHYSKEPLKVNFSTFLSEKLHQEYNSLSRLFSSVEGITIEKFITSQKIEKVKELLFYGEFSLSEISYQLSYSSVAHLSAQFKKETGMTPSAFKKQRDPDRKSLDKI